jgi:opine dehydrogenase
MIDFVVLGGGYGACATAAELSLRGASVGLVEVPEFMRHLEDVRRRGGLEIGPDPDHQTGFAPLAVVGSDPSSVSLARTILLVVPAYAERRFVRFAAPWLQTGQTLVFACGTLGEFMSDTNKQEWRSAGIEVAVLEALVQGGRREGTCVRLSTRKRNVRVAAAVGSDEGVAQRLEHIYPDLIPVADPLESALGNLNFVFHPLISLANLGRLGSDFLYYKDGMTPEVGILLETLDAERLSVGNAGGYSLDSCSDTLKRWYLSIPPPPLWRQVSGNPAYAGWKAPRSLEHRFLLEDVPYGLAQMEKIAKSLGVPTPLASALIDVASNLLRRDLRMAASEGTEIQGRNRRR